MSEIVFTNARLVLADRVVEGSLRAVDGVIEAVDDGPLAGPDAEIVDLGGDHLMPGMVELHTDNLERHMRPRPGADWPAMAAVLAHDAELAGCGITTVFDALALGDVQGDGVRVHRMREMLDGIGTAASEGLAKIDHRLHLRCEISCADLPEIVESLIDDPLVSLLSIMDHTPGQRQFKTLDKYIAYYKRKLSLDDDAMGDFIEARRADQERYAEPNRRKIVDLARARGLSLASHDDATPEHVAEAVADGMTIAEFPTTPEAAESSHAHGLAVLMGAPNLVRGGSHSGNVAAVDLARAGHLDIVSSDYAPASLLHSVFLLTEGDTPLGLPEAVATVTRTPARAAGLSDRGELAPGQRADVVRVRDTDHHPVIRGVWTAGHRVA